MPMTDWKEFVTTVATFVGVPGLLLAAYKGWRELQRLNEQSGEELRRRERADQLQRAEFTLTQLRRLFEDQDLLDMLPLLDVDDPKLADFAMLNAKRKFMTFCEEVALLINSGLLSAETAHYMFGYYAVSAHKGSNFRSGLAYTPEHWALFMKFAADAERFAASAKGGTAEKLHL
jgi:hypothetical protein